MAANSSIDRRAVRYLTLLVCLLLQQGQVVAEEGCAAVPIELVLESPAAHADQPACLSGTYRYFNGNLYLSSEGLSEEEMVEHSVLVYPTIDDVKYGDIRTGDQVEVSGQLVVSEQCFNVPAPAAYNAAEVLATCREGPPLTIFPRAIQVTSREVSTADCQHVPITELYDNPLPYDETVVCTEGYILTEVDSDLHNLEALVPAGFPPEQVHEMSISFGIPPWELGEHGLRRGDHVAVRGRFEVTEDCYNAVHFPEQVEGETFCWPIAVPMYITHAQIELLN